MKSSFRYLLAGACVLAVHASSGSAHAGLWPFKKKAEKPAPSAGELQSQEAAAAALLQQAERTGKYRQVVEKYPLTSAAATAQYQIAKNLENEGKLLRAFDEYQALINTYKASNYFGPSLDSQFEIALKARTEKLDSMLKIKTKVGKEETIKLFKQVVDNAPQGPHAAQSKIEMAKIYEDDGSTEAAVATYQDVVDQYPRSPQATEAKEKMKELSAGRLDSKIRDMDAVTKAREKLAESGTGTGVFPDPNDLEIEEKISEKEAENAYKVGRFYERAGNKKAAIIYYNDVLRYPGGTNFEAARDRVNALTTADPALLDQGNVKISNKQLAVRAEADTKSRPDYLGPPAPAALERMLRKPKMRTGTDPSIPITPIDEPPLPGDKPTGRPDDLLLDPNRTIPATDLALPPTGLDAAMPDKPSVTPEEEAKKATPVEEPKTENP